MHVVAHFRHVSSSRRASPGRGHPREDRRASVALTLASLPHLAWPRARPSRNSVRVGSVDVCPGDRAPGADGRAGTSPTLRKLRPLVGETQTGTSCAPETAHPRTLFTVRVASTAGP